MATTDNKSTKNGWVRIPNFLFRSKTLSDVELRLFGTIKSLNPAFPSYKKIREWTGLSRGSISNSIKKLVSLNMIKYGRGKSKYNTNKYEVLPEEDWNIPVHFKSQYTNKTPEGPKNELTPVPKAAGKKNKKKKQAVVRSPLTTKTTAASGESLVNTSLSAAAEGFRTSVLNLLKEEKYFAPLKKLTHAFIKDNGPVISKDELKSILWSKFLDDDGRKRIGIPLLAALSDAYDIGLREFNANGGTVSHSNLPTPCNQPISSVAKPILAKSESKEQALRRIKLQFKKLVENPIYKGVLTNKKDEEDFIRRALSGSSMEDQ